MGRKRGWVDFPRQPLCRVKRSAPAAPLACGGWHGLNINFRIVGVVVFGVQIFLHDAQGIAEALEMDDFACAEELDRVPNVGIVDQTKQIVVCGARLLFCRKILKKIGDCVALDLQRRG